MQTRATPSNGVLLWRGVSRACPACGQRRLTHRWVGLAEECPRCGFVFERQSGHFVGAVGMNTIATFAMILVSILVGIWLLWPDVDGVRLGLPPILIAAFMPPIIHPTAKTLWIAIDLMMTPLRPGEAVRDLVAEEAAPREG